MSDGWLLLLLAAAALFFALDRFGLLVRRRGWSIAGGSRAGASAWKGSYRILTGRLSKNFVTGPGRGSLVLCVETGSGRLSIQVKGSGGALLYQGESAGSAPFRVDVRGQRRCQVTLRGEGFRGAFQIYLS